MHLIVWGAESYAVQYTFHLALFSKQLIQSILKYLPLIYDACALISLSLSNKILSVDAFSKLIECSVF